MVKVIQLKQPEARNAFKVKIKRSCSLEKRTVIH